MKELLKNKKIIIICIFLILIFYIFSKYLKKDEQQEIYINTEYKYLDKYECNQFIPVKVEEHDVAEKYLNDYKNIILTDLDEAYTLLNKEYREIKFKDINIFKEYMVKKRSREFYKMEVNEYSIYYKDGKKYIYIIASNGDKFIFKENSIMNYEVFLDNYTV